VLEHLPGGTLEDRLSDGRPLPDAESERIAAELAAGLAHAHANGVVHRDLKPSNVLFDPEGRAKLSDFGIARAAGQATLTETGTVLGTAGYIAPEQATGDPVGPAADVYSFGVILFRMLTGRLPFVADHPVELALKHRDEAPPAIRDVRPDAPASLAAIVSTALEKDPARRPPDGAALVAALAEPPTLALARSGPRAEVRPAPVPATPRRRWDRRRSIAALAVAAVLFGSGLAAALLIDTGGSSPSLSTRATTHHRRTTSSTSATTGATTTTSQSTTAATTTAAQTTSPGTTAATTTAATTTTSTTIPATTAPTTP
jgi:serine/threonine-protein kinase